MNKLIELLISVDGSNKFLLVYKQMLLDREEVPCCLYVETERVCIYGKIKNR